MTAANKKFQQLKRKVQAIDAWKNLKDKQTETQEKFPHCRNQFDTCPSEEDLKSALKQKMAPSVCGACPVFQASNVKGIKVMAAKPRMSDEDLEYYKKVMEK